MPSRYPREKTAARGYGGRWQRYRIQFLQLHPMCAYCKKQGRLTPANVVDHIIPHKGDPGLFWDTSNHQAMCAPCHDRHKAGEESSGYSGEVGQDGWPVDPQHPSNKGRAG